MLARWKTLDAGNNYNLLEKEEEEEEEEEEEQLNKH
jgi:hypothetical protein